MREFTDEQKLAAVARAAKEGIAVVAADIKVSPSVVRNWKQRVDAGHAVSRAGKRREYDEAFKLAAIRRIQNGERLTSISADLDVHATVIRRWQRELKGKRIAKPPVSVIASKALEKTKAVPVSEAIVKKALERIAAGEKATNIAIELGVTASAIYNWRARDAEGTWKAAAQKNGGVQDAIIYLRHARAAFKQRLEAGKAQIDDPFYMLTMLALSVLEGKL